jgi:hypothetical protein
MIFDIHFPAIEFRIRIQILCREGIGKIFKFLEIDLKVPRVSWEMLWHYGFEFSPLIYTHWRVCELGKMPRSGCYRILLFNKIYRDYYDGYQLKEK